MAVSMTPEQHQTMNVFFEYTALLRERFYYDNILCRVTALVAMGCLERQS